ncbi:hypothetical protein I9Y33_002664 [Clostridium perfringens]|nr:hypothetical protein [Clostridium perfringens]EGT0014769.1 hypothetical protein [Clostridium perfringens]
MNNNKCFKYAKMTLSDNLSVIIDADEYNYVSHYYNSLKEFRADLVDSSCLDSESFKIVYGALIKQEYVQLDEALIEAKRAIGHTLGYIDYSNNSCILSDLVDLKIYRSNLEDRVPFAALIKTSLQFSEEPLKEKSLFTRYSNLTFIKNILNRQFILSCAYEFSAKDITKSNWTEYINNRKVVYVFKNIK